MADEAYVKSKICNYLDELKEKKICYWERRNAVGFNYKKGIPDLWCVVRGVHYEIETKDVTGETSVMQDKQKVKLENAGCVYILAKSLQDVKNIIKENE